MAVDLNRRKPERTWMLVDCSCTLLLSPDVRGWHCSWQEPPASDENEMVPQSLSVLQCERRPDLYFVMGFHWRFN